MRGRALRAVADREFRTLCRTPAYLLLGGGTVVLVMTLAWTGSPAGYLPLVLDLATPLAVVVPVVSLGFGYRAILADRSRGELEITRSYPIAPGTYVLGVFLGRAIVVLAVLFAALAAAGLLVALTGAGGTDVVATHATVDSPFVYLRLVVDVAGYGLVTLAVALVASAAAGSIRSGIVFATGLGLALIAGVDAALVAALTGGLLSADVTTVLTAFSPASAFRTLVFSLAVSPVGAVDVPTGPGPLVALIGLGSWLVGSLAGAAWLLTRE